MGGRLTSALAVVLGQPGTRGTPPEPPDPGSTSTVTLQPSSWHTRRRASLEGTFGPNTSGRYVRIPGVGATPNVYAYCTNDRGDGVQVGTNPGPLVAELAGYTGVVVALGSGNITAATRAAAMRAALTTAGYYTSVGGTGSDVVINGSIGVVTTGGIHTPTGGAAGTRRSTPQYFASTLSGRVGQFLTWAGGSVLVDAIGIYLAATPTDVAIAVYTGGSAGSLAGTTLRGEAVIASGGAAGWQWSAVPTFTLNNGSVRLTAKSNGTSIPGYIGSGDTTGTDFADALEIYSEVASNPATPWSASLSGETVGSTSPVYVMMALSWRAANGSSGVFTTRVGVHVATVTDLAQVSSLTAPDAGGADLMMGVANPGMLGLELGGWGIGQGPTHTTQGQAFVAAGGSIGNGVGATVLWRDRTTGSGTNAWLRLSAPAGVAVPSSGPLWWGVRNNVASFSFRFAFNADQVQANPDDNPADWSNASEYEIFRSVNGNGTGGNVHVTDPAIDVVSPIATDGAAVATNQNFPASYIDLQLPEDTAA